MANLSPQTRKQQVLIRLRAAQGGWVDGPELANEECGGSEGLRRLRELVEEDGFNVRKRRHPDPERDIWQYRLVPPRLEIPIDDEEPEFDPAAERARMDAVAAELAARRAIATPQTRLPNQVEPPPAPRPEPEPQGPIPRISTAIQRKEDGTFEYVPPQRSISEQLTIPVDEVQPEAAAFVRMPAKVVWGDMAVCPRCKMKTTRGRKPKPRESQKEGETQRQIMARRRKEQGNEPSLIDADGVLLFKDPKAGKKTFPCKRCNGYGIVPNQGPIPFTPPTGLQKPEPALDLEADSIEAFP